MKENGGKCVLCLDIFGPSSYLCLYHFWGVYNAFLPRMTGATTENDIPAPLVQALVFVLAHDQLN